MTEPQPEPSVNRVAVKLPPFWKDNPRIWFAQVEAQFIVAGINVDSTKFNTVVASIESHIINQVAEAIINPPPEKKYENLKKLLLERYSASEQENIRKLISELELGDKKPSQLLQEMRHLGGSNCTDQILQTLWYNRLPTNTQAILQVTDGDLNQKAAIADKISEVSNFSTISQTSSTSHLEDKIRDLDLKINQLLSNRSRSSSSNHQRSRSRSKTPSNSSCWFHRVFKEKARKCQPPCNYNNSSKN